jgi:protein phosphatase
MDADSAAVQRRRVIAAPVPADTLIPVSARVRAHFGASSHRGRLRTENDDHYLILRHVQHLDTLLTSVTNNDLPTAVDEFAYAAVVADGIGPAGSGSVAARLAVSTLARVALRFGHWHSQVDPSVAAEVLERAEWLYQQTDEVVRQRSQAEADLTGMAATLTGIYSVGTDLFVANIGHSRCYLFRAGALVQLTRDDTLRQRLATSGSPVPVVQAIDDMHHILTNVIGTGEAGARPVVEHFRLVDDDTLLLCTNGLTDTVSDDAIAEALASRRTQADQCEQLVDLALENGTEDNVTVVIANYRVLASIQPSESSDAYSTSSPPVFGTMPLVQPE